MKFTAYLVATDPAFANWLKHTIVDVEFVALRVVSVADFTDQLDRLAKADLVLFEMDVAEVETRCAMMEQLLERLPDVAVAAVGREPHPDVVLQAMRAGARDFWVMHRDDAALPQAAARLLRRSQSTPAAATTKAADQGRVFALVSSHPLDGIGFTAAHLALALQSLERGDSERQRTLLFDCASPAGAAAIFLNLTVGYTVLDALGDVYRCDQTLIDTAFVRHKSGLYVLSLPEDLLGAPKLDPEMLGRLIGILRGLFSDIVLGIDGHAGREVLSEVLPQVDRLVWLADQSILRSRQSRHLLRALHTQGVSLPGIGLLVDAYQRRLGLEPEHLAELLEIPLLGTLTGDPAARIQSMNTGDPMFKLFPKDPFVADINELARVLRSGEPVMGAPRGQGGLLKRWMS
ncbi:MAG: hypothetical protein CMK02_08700 [Polycyclovorans sp.]|nr:hypothetical protein [Polycyclovorans sp.]|tara:strand:- start:11563 stop:12774 length:1212 start_codon:yes stop_codon:yes gene_type:complete